MISCRNHFLYFAASRGLPHFQQGRTENFSGKKHAETLIQAPLPISTETHLETSHF